MQEGNKTEIINVQLQLTKMAKIINMNIMSSAHLHWQCESASQIISTFMIFAVFSESCVNGSNIRLSLISIMHRISYYCCIGR